jgi:hypothetical protein
MRKGDATIDTNKNQRIVREYFRNLYSNTLKNPRKNG